MELRPYQKEGVERLTRILSIRAHAYLADEMGLGKTAQAIRIINDMGYGKVLIVCPAGLRLNWKRELLMWLPLSRDIRAIMKTEQISGGLLLTSRTIVIVSYDLAARPSVLAQLLQQWDCLILDEAHYCKNIGAQRTKACLRHLWKKSFHHLLMSGTPCPNGIIDGFHQFKACAPEMFPDLYKYGFRYTEAKRNWFTGGWEFKGKKNLKELRSMLNHFMVRRRKAEVLTELPDKIYSQIPVEIRKASQYALAPEQVERIKAGEWAMADEHVATARKGLGMLKVDSAVDHIKMVMEEKNRLVVFVYHKDVTTGLLQGFEKFDGEVLVINGEVPATKREEINQRFQSSVDKKIILIFQIQAAIGVNLTAADTAIYVEFSWLPSEMAQSMDRLHRMGQKNAVNIHYLIAQGTMDEQIIDSLREKIDAINGVFGKGK